MIKCFEFDKLPDGVVEYVSFYDLASAGVNIVAYCYEPEPTILAIGDGSVRQWRNKI